MDLDLDQLQALMRALNEHDIQELEVEREGERILLRRGPAMSHGVVLTAPADASRMPAGPAMASMVPAATPAGTSAPSAVPVADPGDPNLTYITSPFVGTFYRSPSPDAPSFVNEGERIRPGQVLCIVEAMKLMNEIESEVAGTLVEVLAENGKPVEYGDRLFKVRKE